MEKRAPTHPAPPQGPPNELVSKGGRVVPKPHLAGDTEVEREYRPSKRQPRCGKHDEAILVGGDERCLACEIARARRALTPPWSDDLSLSQAEWDAFAEYLYDLAGGSGDVATEERDDVARRLVEYPRTTVAYFRKEKENR